MFYLCITPDREEKTRMIMSALNVGFKGEERKVVVGPPPEDEFPFVVWGQEWTALDIIPDAVKQNRPFWHIDNGFWNPARGTAKGYYRFTYRSMTPVYLPDEMKTRIPTTVSLERWRTKGDHVLLAMPGIHFGMALGIDVDGWCKNIIPKIEKICSEIDRPLKIRDRNTKSPLRNDLVNAWAVVTHSSNVGVDAAIAGIPVFVEPTCPAAPVGRLDLKLDEPVFPGRNRWLKSLASQHFTLDEMKNGTALFWMKQIAEMVDGNGNG